MKKKINIGVIGLGGISYGHIPTYVKDERVNLAAVCDVDESWLKYRSNELGTEFASPDYREIVNNKNIDAVSVCLPNKFHCEVTVAALEAGKHVLCEKPMAVNAREAQMMHDASVKSGKKLMIRQNQRFEAGSALMKKQIDAGVFGDIYFIRTGWQRALGAMPSPLNKRTDGSFYSRNWFNEKSESGGVLRDLGCHLLDLAMFLVGFPKLKNVSCSMYRKFVADGMTKTDLKKYKFDSEDLAAAHMKFENGMSLEMEVSFGAYVGAHTVFTDLYGTKAGASRRDGTIKFFRGIEGAYTSETVMENLCAEKDSIEAFIDCVVNDTEPPVTSAQGVEIIKLLDALYESAGEIK